MKYLNLIPVTSLIICMGLMACSPSGHSDSAHANEKRAGEKTDKTWRVTSPDETLIFTVADRGEGQLEYRVDLDGVQVLNWSDLGLEVSRGFAFDGPDPVMANFAETVTVVLEEAGTFSQTYEMVTGKQRANRAEANTLSLTLADDETQQQLAFDIRVQDGGFGFRYRLPGEDVMFSVLESEATSFAVESEGRFWGQPYDFPTEWEPAYETKFENGLSIGAEVGDKGTGWGFPSLFEIKSDDTDKDAWLLLHESGLTKSFHGSHLEPDPTDGVYRVAFPLRESGLGFGKSTPSATRPWAMPWRVGIVGRDLGDIVESNLVFDFAEPSKIEDPSWVQAGVSSWSWLSDHASSRDMEKLKNFIDLSAEMGWDYNLVDANWNTISDTSMEELTQYAEARDVGLFFWYNSGGRHNIVPEEPRNIMSDPVKRKAEFAKLQRLGAKGVKVDFFHSDKQDMIALYLDILEDAAAHNIMVNFHGCTIPRGWERTWPNLMSMESVAGGEIYTFPSDHNYGESAPWHNTILPFTRNVIGSMDYTPTIYSDQLIPRMTTNGHETALAVLFESGVQHIADSADSLRALPAEYKTFLGGLPSVWDETKYLSGEPGDHVVVARRHQDQWYVAGINGTPSAKTMTLGLSFLGEPSAEALMLHDGQTGKEFQSSLFQSEDLKSVEIEMMPYGGFVITAQ